MATTAASLSPSLTASSSSKNPPNIGAIWHWWRIVQQYLNHQTHNEHMSSSSPPPPPSGAVGSMIHWFRRLPIIEFYSYMFRVNRRLFFSTLFINYALPLLLELMPWYLSRRKLSKWLRETRTAIQHRLVTTQPSTTNRLMNASPTPPSIIIGSGAAKAAANVTTEVTGMMPLSMMNNNLTGTGGPLFLFSVLSIVYALMQTIEQYLRTRAMLANRLLVKRLLMERILYSEIGSLQKCYHEVYGEEVRTDQLEQRVLNDISETLNLFNSTIPSIIRSCYTFALSANELYQQRINIDPLSIIRPTVVSVCNEIVEWVREKALVEQQTLAMQRTDAAMSRVVTNIVDGLSEIQVNNIQKEQLSRLDRVINEEIDAKQGAITFANNVYRVVNSRSVFDFVSEVYVVQMVLRRRGLGHEQYLKLQNDIDYCLRLATRIWAMIKDAYRVMDAQRSVIALINLPNFLDEEKRLPNVVIDEFHQLRVERVQLRYKDEGPLALNIMHHNQREQIPDNDNDNLDTLPTFTSLALPAPHTLPASTIDTESLSSSLSNASMPVYDEWTDEDRLVAENNRITDERLPQSIKDVGLAQQQQENNQTNSLSTTQPSLNLPVHSSTDALLSPPTDGTVTFERGQTYAVVGMNRCGKSTLMHLLCKLIHPLPGSRIFLNDISYEKIPRIQLRSLITYIPQRPFIFPGTIEENIRVANTAATHQQVQEAAISAGIYLQDRPSLLSSMKRSEIRMTLDPSTSIPLKPWEQSKMKTVIRRAADYATSIYDFARSFVNVQQSTSSSASISSSSSTSSSSSNDSCIDSVLSMETEEGGTNLSGGFAQSVALARVFLRPHSRIVILDESMGAMDAIKKREFIFPHLFEFIRKNHMTLILISHDLPNVCMLVDRVYLMQNGRVVAHGSHQQLLQQKVPAYLRLIGIQSNQTNTLTNPSSNASVVQ